ncbi:MAG TPA: hypothetical protein V6D33_13465 [Cyanophyceae cyanobacterium]
MPKKCQHCGTPLGHNNKSGYCSAHQELRRDRKTRRSYKYRSPSKKKNKDMSKPFTSVEHAIRWSESHNSPATLIANNFQTVVEDAEALGYIVNYSIIDQELCSDDRATYDVWGIEDPESEEMNWRLTVKVELED